MKKNFLRKMMSFAFLTMLVCGLLFVSSCKSCKDDKEEDKKQEEQQQPEPVVSTIDSEFAKELGGVSETFKGAVSEESYETSNKAAEAFVLEEVVGEEEAEIVEVASKGELSSDEINKLNVSSEILEGSLGVEKLEVTYSLEEESSSASRALKLATSKTNKVIVVYVVKYNNSYKYITPLPENGETITKTYYDSVFNSEKYKNCTFDYESSVIIDTKSGDYRDYVKTTIKQFIKYNEDKIYMMLNYKVEGEDPEYGEDVLFYLYFEKVEGQTKCYMSLDEIEWAEIEINGEIYNELGTLFSVTNFEELYPFANQYLDYTYFKKSDYGFELPSENARKYFLEVLMSALSGLGSVDFDKMNIDTTAQYYVSNGVLSGAKIDTDFYMPFEAIGEEGYLKEVVKHVYKCTDYGTTVIERPNLENLIEE